MFTITLNTQEKYTYTQINYRRAVRCVTWNSSGLLLMIRTKQGDYKFPGGGQRSGETDCQTLLREVREETGFTDITPQTVTGNIIQEHPDYYTKDTLFRMESIYYICNFNSDVNIGQKLDSYEAKSEFTPVFVTPYKALLENIKIRDRGNPDKIEWLDREIAFLEKLIESSDYPFMIKKAVSDDLQTVLPIIEDAKAFLALNKVDQWQDGFPSQEDIASDLKLRDCFFVCKNDVPSAFFLLSFEKEELYHTPLEGSLKLEGKYSTIHRTAVSKNSCGRGVSHFMFDYSLFLSYKKGFPVIRIDTHKDNKIMRHLAEREGFEYCELITLAPGIENMKRLVFERPV